RHLEAPHGGAPQQAVREDDRRTIAAAVLDVQLGAADLHEGAPRRRYRWIFPVAVFGSSGTKWICLGTMNPAQRERTCCRSSSASSGVPCVPSVSTTCACGRSNPASSRGVTASSSTAACETSAASTSVGEIHSPPAL